MHSRKAQLDLEFSTKLSNSEVSEVLRCSLACKMVFLLVILRSCRVGFKVAGQLWWELTGIGLPLCILCVACNLRVSGAFND